MYGLFTTEKKNGVQHFNTFSDSYTHENTTTDKWFKEKMRKAQIAPFTEIVTITPVIAKYILEQNPDNRKLNDLMVSQIVKDIKSGFWKLNGETIIISDDGMVNDGQHRLNAIVLADLPVETTVFFGATRESRYTVDMGRQRTVGDFLRMENVKNGERCASVAALYAAWQKGYYGQGSKNYKATKQQIRHGYFENKEVIDRAIDAVGHAKFVIRCGPTSFVCAYVILSQINHKACDEFFEKLISGENLHRGDAIMQARSHAMDFASQRLREWERLELLFKYWNSWRQNRKTTRNHSLSRFWPKIEG